MKIFNRKASFNYNILEKIEAGLVLTGAEVKSIKKGGIKLDEAYVKINPQGEIFLINCHIYPYLYSKKENYEPSKSRKILLHRKEILRLIKKTEGRNLALIPFACYSKKGKIKLEIALGRGKKQWEKRELIKKRDLDREMARALKN